MKTRLIVILILFLSLRVNSQKKIAISLSPHFTYRNITIHKEGLEDTKRRQDSIEQAGFGMGYGLFYENELSDYLRFRIGLEFSQSKIVSNQILFTGFPDYDTLDYFARQKFTFLQIPISFSHQVYDVKDHSFHVGLGLSPSYLIDYRDKYETIGRNDTVNFVEVTDLQTYMALRFNISFDMDVLYKYEISKKFDLELSPYFKYQLADSFLNTTSSRGDRKRFMFRYGVNFRIYYKF